ncbi:hypothetical protein KAX75_00605 [candidate division WOR-3 bacterium]|nr:hypothetical protein [candidate division WOR-3 bacterium]
MIKKIKWLPLVLLIPALFLFVGCPNPEEGEVPNITGLTITADTEGDGIILTWNEISDIEGYDVITPDGDTILLEYDENSYTDDTPASTGTYTVYAVDGGERGNPSTASSAPFTSTSNPTIYVWTSADPSGFGWNTGTGAGTVYNCIDGNKGVVDFYLNDYFATWFHFCSGNNEPYYGSKTTGIASFSTSDFFEAPETGHSSYLNAVQAETGVYYAMALDGDYFAKIHCVSVISGTEATFEYEFQKIKNLRIF